MLTYKEDQSRLEAARERVLALMQARSGQWVANHEICAPEVGGQEGMRRLRELRKRYSIEKRHLVGGVWEYRLVDDEA